MKRFNAKPTRREVNQSLNFYASLSGKTDAPTFEVAPKRLRDTSKGSESKEQVAVMRWWRVACLRYKLPEFSLFHIPNGAGRLSPVLASILKAMGLRAGIPDLCLAVQRCGFAGLYIEMKYGTNKESDNQIEVLEFLRSQGYATATCWTSDAAIDLIQDYLDGRLK